jgi:DNA-binding transcriptional ArsR family regulator
MPRLVLPPTMSPEVSKAIEIIGNRARAAIIRELTRQGPRTPTQLAGLINANREAVYVHIKKLQDLGVIARSSSKGTKAPGALWAVNTDRVADLAQCWLEYLAGKDRDRMPA